MELKGDDLKEALHQAAAMVPQPHEQDAMRVLKGHLVVERNFELFFEDVLPDYSKLERARLTFSQKHQLYRAFHPGDEHSWLWGAIYKLSKLRNELAHSSQPEGFEGKVATLINHIYSTNPWKELNAAEESWGDLSNSLNIVHLYQMHLRRAYKS